MKQASRPQGHISQERIADYQRWREESMQADPYREALITGMQSLLREHPLELITTKEILSRSGVSRSKLYDCFKDKYELASSVWFNLMLSCWYRENQPVSFPDFLSALYTKEQHEIVLVLNAFSYAGQNNLWSTRREILVLSILDYVDRCDLLESLSSSAERLIVLYAIGISGVSQRLLEKCRNPAEIFEITVNPAQLAKDELLFIPQEIKPFLFATPLR